MSSALVSTLVEPKMKSSEKFDYVLQYMKKIAGGQHMGFNNAVFLSERETADRNYAMAYFMKENRCFPPKTKLSNAMDLYFQSCSMETTTESLANGGIQPLTGEKVINPEYGKAKKIRMKSKQKFQQSYFSSTHFVTHVHMRDV